MNKVLLIGRLSKDNELKITQSNKEVLSNTIAVNRSYSDSTGERQTDFINVVFWNERAKLVDKYTKKGDRIAIVGELQTRSYLGSDGTNRYVSEVIVSEIEFLEPKPTSQSIEQELNKEAKDYKDVPYDLSGDDEPF